MRLGRLLALMVLAAAPAWADYKQAYSEAIKALDTRKWADVARLMRQAAAEQPTEGERIKIYGMRFEIYLPHFYLGQALAETNDCAGALKAFATSEEQGAVKKTYHWAELQELRNRCQQQQPAAVPTPTRPAAPPTPDLSGEIRKAEAELARAAEAEKEVAELRRTGATVWQERPALGTRTDQATAKMASARSSMEKGRAGSATELAQAGRLAGEATRELQAVRDEARSRLGELQKAESQRQGQLAEQARQEEARRQALWQELAALSREAASLEGSVGSTGARPEVRQAQADLAQSRSRAVSMTATSSATELQARRDELQRTVERLRQVMSAVPVPSPSVPPAPTAPVAVATAVPAVAPPVLRQGSVAFLEADYRRTVELLDKSPLAEPRAAAVAALLRGAARFALYQEGGGREPAVLDAARGDIRACRRLDATVAPDTAFFSPTFVSLFQETR